MPTILLTKINTFALKIKSILSVQFLFSFANLGCIQLFTYLAYVYEALSHLNEDWEWHIKAFNVPGSWMGKATNSGWREEWARLVGASWSAGRFSRSDHGLVGWRGSGGWLAQVELKVSQSGCGGWETAQPWGWGRPFSAPGIVLWTHAGIWKTGLILF